MCEMGKGERKGKRRREKGSGWEKGMGEGVRIRKGGWEKGQGQGKGGEEGRRSREVPRGAGAACRRRVGWVRQQQRPSLFVLSWGEACFGRGEIPGTPQRTPREGKVLENVTA